MLEQALLSYWDAEAVDLIAERAKIPSALWIAAGLGDVDGVSRFLDRDGAPTAAAHANRPDFRAGHFGIRHMLRHPVADEMDVLAEAFFVALSNQRVNVLDYLLDRGFPIDYMGWEIPFASFAAGNRQARSFECLVRRGANLDLRGRYPDKTPRELARRVFDNQPNDPIATKIFELSGGNPDDVRAATKAHPAPEPTFHSWVDRALAMAGDDAARMGGTHIAPANLLVGILRLGSAMMSILSLAGVDIEQLRGEMGTRITPADDGAPRHRLPLDSATRTAMEYAIAYAKDHNGSFVVASHILRGLADSGDASLRELFVRCGSSLERLSKQLEARRRSDLP